MYDKGFLVVTSNVSIDDSHLPFSLSDKMTISKGTEFERDTFQHVLKDAGYFSKMFIKVGAELKVSETTGAVSWVDNDNFIPYICVYSGFNHETPNLAMAGKLLNPKLIFGMQGMYADCSHKSYCAYTLMSFEDLHWMGHQARNETKTYSIDDLNDLSELFKAIILLEEGNHYRRILELYNSTDLITKNSSLLTLSYFSILEALLTNQDKVGITKQLERKTKLLFNIGGEVDHVPFFGALTNKNLWSKLYDLRSNIAHGNDYTIDINLRDFETVNAYLDLVVSKLLRFSLRNQQLVVDLKSC